MHIAFQSIQEKFNTRRKTMIKIDSLTKYYKKNARGILDVSLEIKKGEILRPLKN